MRRTNTIQLIPGAHEEELMHRARVSIALHNTINYRRRQSYLAGKADVVLNGDGTAVIAPSEDDPIPCEWIIYSHNDDVTVYGIGESGSYPYTLTLRNDHTATLEAQRYTCEGTWENN